MPRFSLVAYIIPRRCSRGRYLYLLPCGSRGSEIEFSVSILRPPSLPRFPPLSLFCSISSSHASALLSSFPFVSRDTRRRASLPSTLVEPPPPSSRLRFLPPSGKYFIRFDRYADTMIFEFLRELCPYRHPSIARVMTSLAETSEGMFPTYTPPPPFSLSLYFATENARKASEIFRRDARCFRCFQISGVLVFALASRVKRGNVMLVFKGDVDSIFRL